MMPAPITMASNEPVRTVSIVACHQALIYNGKSTTDIIRQDSMTSFRAVLITALLALFLSSCGETFRPIATIVPGTGGPAPQVAKTAIVLTDNGTASTSRHFNLSGNTETGAVPVGQGPAFAALVGGLGRVYVLNHTDETLTFYSAVAPSAGANTVTLPSGADPRFVESSANLAFVYVSYNARDSVGVISTSTNAQTAEIQLPPGAAPTAMLTTATGTKLFVAEPGINRVAVVEPATNTIVTQLDFGGGCASPSAFAQKPDASYVYVICNGSNNLFWINTSNNSTSDVPPASLGTNPSSITYDAFRNRIVVTNAGSNTVSFINEDIATPPATYHTVTTVPVGSVPVSATALANGSRVYVADQASNTLTVIDSATLTVKATIPLSGSPQQVRSSIDSLRVATDVAGGTPNLTVVDTTTEAVNTTFPLAADPTYLILVAQ